MYGYQREEFVCSPWLNSKLLTISQQECSAFVCYSFILCVRNTKIFAALECEMSFYLLSRKRNLITRPQFPVPDQQLKVHYTQAPENLQATKPRFMINQTIDRLLKPISIERKERKGSDLTKNKNASKFCFLFCFFCQDFGRGFGLFIKSVNSTEDVEKFCQINILATF